MVLSFHFWNRFHITLCFRFVLDKSHLYNFFIIVFHFENRKKIHTVHKRWWSIVYIVFFLFRPVFAIGTGQCWLSSNFTFGNGCGKLNIAKNIVYKKSFNQMFAQFFVQIVNFAWNVLKFQIKPMVSKQG